MSAEMEAAAVQVALTPAVREELHVALERLCDELAANGKLGVGIRFTLTPADGTPGQGDELGVTLNLQLMPMFDGQPCGHFLLSDFAEGGVVH